MQLKPCCDRLAHYAAVGDGWGSGWTSEKAIVYDGEKWHIWGCCGGHCYVVQEIEFCPFCGRSLAEAVDVTKVTS